MAIGRWRSPRAAGHVLQGSPIELIGVIHARPHAVIADHHQ